jgi:hypothetical protein
VNPHLSGSDRLRRKPKPSRSARPIFLLAVSLLASSLGQAQSPAPDCRDEVFVGGFGEATDSGFDPLAICPTHPINDTGILRCADPYSGAQGECDEEDILVQDARHGRDFAASEGVLWKQGAGWAGFDYTKVSNAGLDLPADAERGPLPDWACTRDNLTRLVWEVKVADANSPRYSSHRYTWYQPDSPDGDPGHAGSTTSCAGTLGDQPCNTSSYVEWINANGLCGFDDWRLASVNELAGLILFARDPVSIIDRNYFPHASFAYWTNQPYLGYQTGSNAWIVGMDGSARSWPRGAATNLRLVRGRRGQ